MTIGSRPLGLGKACEEVRGYSHVHDLSDARKETAWNQPLVKYIRNDGLAEKHF